MIIEVKENKVIGNISYDGVKAKILEALKSNLVLKRRSSFTEYFKKDKEKIISNLKELGYYFSTVDAYVEENNIIDLTFDIKIEIKQNKK